MIIILANIPVGTGTKTIKEFIKPAIKGGLFKKGGHIKSISIQRHEDAGQNDTKQHALVRITPDAAAVAAIKMLNRQPINGKRIEVREYHIRLWQNDPRVNTNATDDIVNKRKGDRRSKNKKITMLDEEVTASFEGDKIFHRKAH